jgi:hypothetical protein
LTASSVRTTAPASASEVETAELGHAQPAALGAELGSELLEPHDPVRDAVKLEVGAVRGAVIEQQYRAPPPGEELLQGQDLTPIAQRLAREQANLGQGVEDHAHGFGELHLLEHRARGFAELDLGGMEDGVLLVPRWSVRRRGELMHGQALQGPAVRGRHRVKLLGALGECHVQTRLASPSAREQKLEGERGLAAAGLAFDEIEPMLGKSTAQDVVEAFDARGDCRRPRERILRRHDRGDGLRTRAA